MKSYTKFEIELEPKDTQSNPLIISQEPIKKSKSSQIFTYLFFLDVYNILKNAQQQILEKDLLPKLKESQQTLKMYNQFVQQYNFSLSKKLLYHFRYPLLSVGIIVLILTIGQLSIPMLIKIIIEYTMSTERNVYNGICLILIVILVRITNIFCSAHSRRMILKIGYDAMSVVNMKIMEKSLNISLLSLKSVTSGEITNLMQVDAQKLQLVTNYLSNVLMIPIQLTISLFLMYNLIGLSFLVGFFIIISMILFNIYSGKQIIKTQHILLKNKDQRTKQQNEIFSYIKFIKINALEKYFLKKVDELRVKEIQSLKDRLFYSAINIFTVWLTPQLILSLTFGLYVFLGQDLTPSNVFAIISLFQILQQPLLQLPISINALIETKLSLNRIERFLNLEELMNDCLKQQNESSVQNAIEMKNALFYWNRQENNKDNQPIILKNINLTIKNGKFISLIGDVGSGKSSLFYSLLGEMLYVKGNYQPDITINGKIAYVGQKPWIQNASVKDNIIFGREFDQQKYEQAIYYSCLEQDLKILINGDQTIIGEKGINLSGGQKARISLARAIYGNADIYLLDDPLSAVDAHVGNFILKQCLLGFINKSTRILITHALNYCKHTDYIYLFENGQIIEEGQYQDMQNSEKFNIIESKFHYQSSEDSESQLQTQDSDELQESIDLDNQKQIIEINIVENQQNQQKNDKVEDLILLEERQKGNIEFNVFLQYFAYDGGYISFIFVIIIMIIWIASYLGSSLWITQWAVHSETSQIQDNFIYFIVYFSLGLSQAIFAFIRASVIIKQSIKSSTIIHNKMMNCLIYAPQCSFFERVPQGRIMNRLTKDINTLDTEIYWNISWLYTKLSQLISNTFLNIYASTYFIILPILLFFTICMKVQRLYMKASRELQRLELISKSPILSYFTETLSGLSTIRAYQQQERFLIQFSSKIDDNKTCYYQQILANAWFLQILGLSSLLVNITAIIYCILYTDNPAYAGLLMTYASNIDLNILQTVESLSLLENGIISFERCLSYTKIQSENRNENNPQIQKWPIRGEILFNNFSVQYRENLPPALQNITIQINKKEKIGIVGRTGAGKSSITLSLLRIIEALNGQIIIDNVDISSLSLQQLRESITIILQDAVIFNGTIRENLDPQGRCLDQEIKKVLEQCCLGRILNERNGLDTIINEGGDNLSQGEKQLICIARAVLKKSKIIIIDEATANIDIETEQKIQEVIIDSFKECTVISIAHRIKTILHCDKILVLDQGQVKEFGQTNDLLNDKESLFYSIYQEALVQASK